MNKRSSRKRKAGRFQKKPATGYRLPPSPQLRKQPHSQVPAGGSALEYTEEQAAEFLSRARQLRQIADQAGALAQKVEEAHAHILRVLSQKRDPTQDGSS